MTTLISNKHQEYTYSLKTVAADTTNILTTMCLGKALFYIVPPEDAQTIQYLRTHFKFKFDSSIDPAYRRLDRIGIVDAKFSPTYERYLDLGLTADGNREVEVNINLTPLLKKDNVAYTLFEDAFGTGYTYIYILLAPEIEADNIGSVGEMRLWKADALFTTLGIR